MNNYLTPDTTQDENICPYCGAESYRECHSWVEWPQAYERVICNKCHKKHERQYNLEYAGKIYE